MKPLSSPAPEAASPHQALFIRRWPVVLFVVVLTAWAWRLGRPYSAYRDANSLNQHRWALNMGQMGLASEGVPVVETRPPAWRRFLELKYENSTFFTLHRTKPMVQMVHYPPGLAWTSVLVFKTIGDDPWCARLIPIGFLALGWWSLFWMARRFLSPRQALWVCGLFGGAPVVVAFSQHLDYVPLSVGLGLAAMRTFMAHEETPSTRGKVAFGLWWLTALFYGWFAMFLGVLPLLGEIRRGRGWFWRLLPYGLAPLIFVAVLVTWFGHVGGGAALDDLKELFTKRTVGNAVEVNGQFMPIPWRLWFTVVLARPLLLFSPLVVLLYGAAFRLLRKKGRPLVGAFLKGGWREQTWFVETCLWAWGLCPMLIFRQVAFVHGYNLMFLAPALAWTLGTRLARLSDFKQAAWALVWLVAWFPSVKLVNTYLHSGFMKLLAQRIEGISDNRTIILTDLYDEGIWSWEYYYTTRPVMYGVNSLARLREARKAIPPGYRAKFFTLPLPGVDAETHSALWAWLSAHHRRTTTGVFSVFDFSQKAPQCWLKPNQQEPLATWGDKVQLWNATGKLGRNHQGPYLDYTLTLNARRAMMADLALFTFLPETGQMEAYQPVNGQWTNRHWPLGRRCVKQHRRIYLPQDKLPEHLSLHLAWCDPNAIKPLCQKVGRELFGQEKPQWSRVLRLRTPLAWKGANRPPHPLPTRNERLAQLYQYQLALPFLKAFELDPMLAWSTRSIEASLQGDTATSYALKSRAIYRHRLILLIEAMIPYALSTFAQGLGMEAMKDASKLGNPLGAARHGLSLAYFLVPSYEMLAQAAAVVCRQAVAPGCTTFIRSAARIKPDRMAEMGLMAYGLGHTDLARELVRKSPPSVARSAVKLLALAQKGGLSDLRDYAHSLRAKGELEPALAVIRRTLPPAKLLGLYASLGPVVTRRLLQRDAYFYIDTGDKAGFNAVMNYYELNVKQ